MQPKVSVIILNWNQPEFTVNCIKSVLDQDYQDFEILLLDNGSRDDSVKIFRKEFGDNERIQIVASPDNLGYAGGNNEGVKKADGEYAVILNNDTTVERDWLGELVRALEGDEKIAAVSATEIRGGEAQEGRNIIDLKKMKPVQTLLGYSAYYKLKKPLERAELVDVFGIDGCSFIYQKELANPPFDPDYFIYAEDAYLGWLLRLKGYRTMLSTTAIVHHFHNVVKKKEGQKINKYFVYLGERNRILNMLTLFGLGTLVKIMPLLLINVILMNIFEPRKAPCRAKSYLWLLTHPGLIIKKRKRIQVQRMVPDSTIIAENSCKLMEETRINNPAFRTILVFLNGFFRIYCRLVNLKTGEIEQ